MGTLEVDKLDPQSGTALEIGTSGDTATVPSGATLVVAGTLNPSGTITAGTIAGSAIANDAIDSAHYADGSIDNAHIADDAIDSEHYADGSIDTAHIADNQVTLAKMAGLARGKIIYGDSSGDPAALAVGTNGQALVSDGTDISWGSAGASLSGSTNNTVATVTGASALIGEANLTFDGSTLGVTGTMGVVTAKDLGVGIHIRTADSGACVASGADEFVIEGSGSSGMTILSGTSGNGIINFGDSGDNDIGQIYYSHSSNNMVIATNGATAMNIDSSGHTTTPLNPSFMIQQTSQGSYANGHTIFSSNITERYDTNADVTTSTFTAPVTGKYILAMNILYNNVTGDHVMEPYIKTSNREYSFGRRSRQYSNETAYVAVAGTVIADMDANDTAYCAHQGGDPQTVTASSNNWCYFAGALVG